MSRDGFDVGFVPVGVPGASGTGSTQTATLLIEQLSKCHDLTVYILAKESETVDDLPCPTNVNYQITRYRGKLPHPHQNRRKAFKSVVQDLEDHELVHSYSCGYVPELSEVQTPTVVTLNSFLPVCAKDSLEYYDGSHCEGPNLSKCIECITRSQDYLKSPKTGLEHAYYQFGYLPYVKDSLETHQNIDAFHTLAPHLVEEYEKLRFKASKMTTIPHYYDERFESDTSALGEPVQLLYVGKLSKKKGVDILPKSLAKTDFEFELKIAGKGSEEDTMRKEFERFGIRDNVEFFGYVDYEKMPDVYAEADIFLYPGRWAEPFGRVFLEAMASKTPVVATDVGSVEYILGDAGIVYSEDRFKHKLNTGLTEIMTSYDKYVEACEREVERFQRETVISQFNDLYANLVRDKG